MTMWHCSELTPSSRKEGSHLLRGHRPRPFTTGTAAVSVAPKVTALCRSLCAALGWRVWPPSSNQANLEGSPSLTAAGGCGLHPACRAPHPNLLPKPVSLSSLPIPSQKIPQGSPLVDILLTTLPHKTLLPWGHHLPQLAPGVVATSKS